MGEGMESLRKEKLRYWDSGCGQGSRNAEHERYSKNNSSQYIWLIAIVPTPQSVSNRSMGNHEANTRTLKSTLPVAITHLTFSFPPGSSFFPVSPFAAPGVLITPGAHLMQLTKCP